MVEHIMLSLLERVMLLPIMLKWPALVDFLLMANMAAPKVTMRPITSLMISRD